VAICDPRQTSSASLPGATHLGSRHAPSPAADPALLLKRLQAGVPPTRAANERSRALWAADFKDDSHQRRKRLSGLAEQMETGVEARHEGIAEAHDTGKPALQSISATPEAVLNRVRTEQGAG
jgi:hypothetical protein